MTSIGNTHKTPKMNRRITQLMGCLAGVAVIALYACSPESSDSTGKSTRTITATPKKVEKRSETQRKSSDRILTAIDACECAFELNEMQKEYSRREEQSSVVNQAFDSKWKALTKGMKPRTLIEGLDFLAVRTKATGDKEYTFSFLLRSTANLDTDYNLTVLGFVFPSNVKFLPEGQRERRYRGWNLLLVDDPTSQWKQGEYHVVHLKAKTDRLIPYNLRLILQLNIEPNRWANPVGARLAMGWQWAILDEESFLARIEACNNFAELYALAPAGPRMSAPVAQAVEKKWKALTAGVTPRPLIEGLLDFLALDIKATGEKEYTFSILLQFTANWPENYRDYNLTVAGLLDQSHMDLANPGKKYISWRLFLNDNPMSQWKAGEYHVAQLKAPIDRLVPLEILIGMEIRGAQTEPAGHVIHQPNVGWQVDILE